jgi:hypothetical protein
LWELGVASKGITPLQNVVKIGQLLQKLKRGKTQSAVISQVNFFVRKAKAKYTEISECYHHHHHHHSGGGDPTHPPIQWVPTDGDEQLHSKNLAPQCKQIFLMAPAILSPKVYASIAFSNEFEILSQTYKEE